MKSRLFPSLFVLVAALPASAAEVFKANNTTALSDSASWAGGGPPGTADVGVWDAPVAANTSPLGASMTWGGIKVVNPGGNVTISPTDGATLSLGSTGIDLSASTRNLTINAALTPVADQAWNVAASRSLTLAAQTGGAGVTITRTGDGTLNFNNTAANSTFAANLLLSGGTTRIVNGSGSQTFSGSISGSAALARTGNGTVVLSGNNAGFSGAFTISGSGPVHLAHANALGTATVNFNAPIGAVLDNVSGAPLTLSAGASLTLSNPLTFTGTHDLDLGASPLTISGDRTLTVNAATLATSGAVTAEAGSLTKAGAGTLALQPGALVGLSGKLAVTGGTLRITGATVECGTSGTGNLEIGDGGVLELKGGALRCPAVSRPAGTAELLWDGGTLTAVKDDIAFISGLSNVWVGAGGAVIDTDGWWVTVPQVLDHDSALGDTLDGGLLVRDTMGNGKLTLTGASTYTGPTIIESGILVIGAGGSLAASQVIEVGDLAELDAAAGLVLASGQTLRGTGAVHGKLTVGPGATLSPGTAATPYVEMDMFDSALTLQGTAEFGIRKTPPEIDLLAELDRVTYGGMLKVTAEPGTFFVNGDRFVLFDALRYAGAFAAFDLPPLSAGLFWEPAGLLTDGAIEVINTLPQPLFNPAPGRSFGTLDISITGVTGSTIHYTTDGSDPQVSPTRISAPSPVTGLTIPEGSDELTIRAYQTRSGAPDGAEVTAVYATADAGVWAYDGSGLWSDPAMWLEGIVAEGPGVTADFATVELGASATATLDETQTIGRLLFGNEVSTGVWTLDGNTLTLDNKTAMPEIQVAADRTATVTAPLAGTSGLLKSGGGTLVTQLAKPALSGDVVIRQGTVHVDRQTALGSGTITLGDAQTGDAEAAILQRGSDPWPPAADFGTANNIIVAAGPTGRLVIGRQNAGNYAAGYSGTITLQNNVVLRNNGADRLSIDGKITGTGNVLIESAGGSRVNMGNDTAINDFLGDITVAAGAIFQPNHHQAIPATANVTLLGNMGTNVATGLTMTFGALNGSAIIYRLAGGDPTLAIGATNQNGDFSGEIRNDFPVTKVGSGEQILSGPNSYTGATTVTAGTLRINNTTASGTGSGNVTVNSPGTLGGSGTISGTVTVNAGATLAPGADAQSTGTLTTGALTLAGTYQCQVEGTMADRLTVTGKLILTNSTLAISALGATEAGTRVIASYTDTRTGTFGGTLPAGYSVSYNDTAKQVLLTVPGGADPYGTWAASKGLTAANNGKTQDPDGDGVSNLLEFYLNGDPLAANSAILPKVVAMDATTVTFGWTRLDSAESSVPVQNFQYGSTITGWTNVPIGATGGPGPNGIVVNIAENDAAADAITVVIPRTLAAGGKLFGRLYLSEQSP